MTPHYEVYAIRYAGFAARTRRETFLGLDPHDAAPMPIDYFLWVIRDGQRTIVVDTGFDEAEGAARGRAITHHPRAALALLGVDAGQVEDVIVTHLHYDHAGTLDAFPRARFHLQEAEMAYATGYCMAHEALRHPYSVEHVVQMVRCVYSGRVRFVRGDAEIAPGPETDGDEAILADVRARCSSVFHPVSTCRMGPDPRIDVVDNRLRVYGAPGLRVVDASIFPTLTSGNTNVPAIMVGEKGADLILADHDAA